MKSLKLISLILCIVLLCCFATACGENNSADSSTKPADSTVETVTSSESESETASNDTQSSDVESGDTHSTSSTDNSSSNTTDTSSEQTSTEATPEDSTALTVYVESKQDGNTVTTEIKIKNNPGLTAFNFGLQYNTNALKPNKLTKGLVSVTSNLQQNQNLSGKVTFLYVDAEGFSDNGTLATVTFDVKDSGKPFDLLINTTQNSFLKLDGKTYVVDFVVK